MRHVFFIFFICAKVIVLSGCWDRTEINDLALIQGIGIDQKGNGNMEVTVQFASPKMMNAGKSGGAGGSEMLTRRGEGETLSFAIANLQEKLPRRVFWGQNKVIVLGETLAKKGIRENIDFFMRHPQTRKRSYVFVAKGTAKEVMELLPPLEQSSAEVLRELAKSNILMGVTVKDLVLMLHDDGGRAALPMIKKLPPEKGLEPIQTIATNPYINSSAIFKEGKMIGTINDRETRGVLWIKNEVREAMVTVKPDKAKKGVISARINQSNTDLIPQIQHGKWKMIIQMEMRGDIIQNGTDLNIMDPKVNHHLEQELARDVENRIQTVLQKIQKEKKVDILGFGELFHQTYPQEWKKVKDHWDEVFPEVTVSYNTRLELRSGMATSPPAISEKR